MASSGESDGGESSSSGEEAKGDMSEYEKQRFSRIDENKARLEALGITNAAKALVGSGKGRGKRKSGEEEDDYRPGEADDEDEDEDEDEEFVGNSTRKRKKIKSSASKRKVLSPGEDEDEDEDEDDDDLKKAIALSLQDSVAGDSGTCSNTHSKRMRLRNDQEASTWKKKKTELMSKTQITEDELLIYFYQFDEAGKGFITVRDVAKMARLHDFTWTEEELQDMVRCFDMDKGGKLSLGEFRKIVTRCHMLKDV